MNSDNLALLSKKSGDSLYSSRNYASNPLRIAIKHHFQVKIKQSYDNLFNFINDNF